MRNYHLIVSILFLIIAILHIVRAVQGWAVTVGPIEIEMWVSYLAAFVALLLAYHGLKRIK